MKLSLLFKALFQKKYKIFSLSLVSWVESYTITLKSKKRMTKESFSGLCEKIEKELRKDNLNCVDNPYSTDGFRITLAEEIAENLVKNYNFKVISFPDYKIFDEKNEW